MEEFNHQEYRKDLANELKKIPDHKDRALAKKNEEGGFIYEEAEKRHREDVEVAMEKREKTLAEKLESAGLVIDKKAYDEFMVDMKSRIVRYKDAPDDGGCTCGSGSCENDEETPDVLAKKLFGDNFTTLLKYIADKDKKVTKAENNFYAGECVRVSELVAAVEALQRMGIIVTTPQDKLPLSQFERKLQPTTTWSSDKNSNTIGYRNFLNNELRKIGDHKKRAELLQIEKNSLVYTEEEKEHRKNSLEYVTKLEPFREKVAIIKAVREKLDLDNSLDYTEQSSRIRRIRYHYVRELYIKEPNQFVDVAK